MKFRKYGERKIPDMIFCFFNFRPDYFGFLKDPKKRAQSCAKTEKDCAKDNFQKQSVGIPDDPVS